MAPVGVCMVVSIVWGWGHLICGGEVLTLGGVGGVGMGICVFLYYTVFCFILTYIFTCTFLILSAQCLPTI